MDYIAMMERSGMQTIVREGPNCCEGLVRLSHGHSGASRVERAAVPLSTPRVAGSAGKQGGTTGTTRP